MGTETDVVSYLRTLAAAEAQTAAARWDDAAPLWQQVVAHNPVTGAHWDRLAEARYELGDYAGALTAYERVQDLGVMRFRTEADSSFPGEVSYRIACCYARLGNTEDAISWLAEAIREGLRDLERPASDQAWSQLIADDRVRALLGIFDLEGLTRTQGWQADLTFFARELKRRAFAPWRETTEAEFDAKVHELTSSVSELSDAEIMCRLMELLRPLGDGHAWISPPPGNDELRLTLPVKFYSFAEGLFITAADPEYSRLVGARVLEVGGRAVDSVLSALEPLLSRDNSQQLKWQRAETLRWSTILHALGVVNDPGSVQLKVQFPGAATGEVAVAATAASTPDFPASAHPAAALRPRPTGWISLPDIAAQPLPLYLRNPSVAYWFEYMRDDGLVYLQVNGVHDHPAESLASFFDRVFAFIGSHPVDRLVIDLRWNPGGNTFLTQVLLHHLIGCPQINHRGGLFVIIGRAMFSAAQNTATAIERETEAIFVGESSGSRPNFVGESIPFTLPFSKMRVNISDLYWQTSWPMDHRPWISPDIYTPPTFEAYSQNRDLALDAILSAVEHLPGY